MSHINCNLQDEIFLIMDPSEWLFTEPEAKDALKKLQRTLKQIEVEIRKRNYSLKIRYEVRLPSKIPYGIAI